MAKIDLYHLYLSMEKEDIILSFKGDITNDLLSSVYQIVESRLDAENEDPRRKKKFYHVLVECLQNMYHHMETFDDETHEIGVYPRNAIFMIGRNELRNYRVITGNFIQNDNAQILKQRIDKINGMNQQELKSYYLERLGATELSEKGGAGLGIIEIARKSGNKIDYDFHSISEKYSFFTLTAQIN